jgi:hypothetical protein
MRRHMRHAGVLAAADMAEAASDLHASIVEVIVSQHVEDVVCHELGPTFVAPLLRCAAGRLQLKRLPRTAERRPSPAEVFVPGDGSTVAGPGDLVLFRLTVAESRDAVWAKTSPVQYDLRIGRPAPSGDAVRFPALEEVLAKYSLGTQVVVDVPFEHGFGSRGSKELHVAPFQDFVMKVKIASVTKGG